MSEGLIVSILCSILVILLIILIIVDKQEKKKKLDKLRKLSYLNLSDLHIEEFDKYVNITMMSGDTFKNIDMEEYESINDPMKKGSYRIHRKAIESERHHSLGKGYFNFDGDKVEVVIYGDENKNILELDARGDKIRETLGFDILLWNYRKEPYQLSAEYYARFENYKIEIEK